MGTMTMSSKLTRILVPGHKGGDFGFMDWGENSREQMVQTLRNRSEHLKLVAAAIDATPDADFQVDIVLGSVVQKLVRSAP